MGIFDFLRGEFIEVIDWVEDTGSTVMWKFPDKGNDIKYGAQLTVREAQHVLLIDEGKLADQFDPGRYELHTQNIPILTKLRNWDKAFNSPYKVDVYYFSTKTFTDLKWGTPNPVMLRDPEFKQVRVRAFGTYFIKIKDAALFFREFAGTAPVLDIAEIEEKLRDIVSPKFAEALGKANIAVLDLVTRYTELGETVRPVLQADLDRFGIELVKFQITSTSLPPEVEAFYDKMTNMNMVGNDMSKFQQFQMGQAIEASANNPGGGSSGVDMGMGMAMSKMMMDQMNQQNTANSPGAAPDTQSVMDLLKQLGELKEAGVLTEEEFQAKKAELLKRI